MGRQYKEQSRERKTKDPRPKARTNQKGKYLFHPIRVALTGKVSGPELDKLLPIFEKGSQLSLPKRIKGCRERVSEFMAAAESIGF